MSIGRISHSEEGWVCGYEKQWQQEMVEDGPATPNVFTSFLRPAFHTESYAAYLQVKA